MGYEGLGIGGWGLGALLIVSKDNELQRIHYSANLSPCIFLKHF